VLAAVLRRRQRWSEKEVVVEKPVVQTVVVEKEKVVKETVVETVVVEKEKPVTVKETVVVEKEVVKEVEKKVVVTATPSAGRAGPDRRLRCWPGR